MAIYCGIDPGLTGALAFLDISSSPTIYIYDMPTLEVTTGDSKRKIMQPEKLVDMIDARVLPNQPFKGLIENVHSTPNDGHVGAFTFGKATGIVIGVFTGTGLPLDQVTPGKWKKDMRVPADKDEAITVASRLLPMCKSMWSRKKDHGRAEAALIALYLAIREGFKPSSPIILGNTDA